MAIEFSRAAEDDLFDIFLYGIETHGLQQAERYKRLLDRTFGLLSANPNLARERYEMSPPVRIHPVGTHVVVYITRGETVLVLRVRHARETWAEMPL